VELMIFFRLNIHAMRSDASPADATIGLMKR